MRKGIARLYYEAHITVEVPDSAWQYAEKFGYEAFCVAAEGMGWKASKFEYDDVDNIAGMWFMSAKDNVRDNLKKDVYNTLEALEGFGLTVARWKIEKAILDSKYGDQKGLLL